LFGESFELAGLTGMMWDQASMPDLRAFSEIGLAFWCYWSQWILGVQAIGVDLRFGGMVKTSRR